MPDQPTKRGQVIVNVFGRTDVGRTREHNEDAFVVADLTTMNATLQPEVRTHVPGERGTLFMVADGMGGAAAGEIASSMAIEIVLEEMEKRWRKAPTSDPLTFATALKNSIGAANSRIHKFAAEHPEHRGMGTTATAAGLLGDTVYLTQVGDSRAYVIRDGKATQITKDQSLMQKLIEAGEITAEEAEQSERRNIILQALGPEGHIKIDLTSQKLRRGDTLVLCSDGLSGQVRADEIAKVVNEQADPIEACKTLIDRANEMGGPDNITVIIARIEGEGLERSTSADALGHKVYSLGDEDTPTVPVERYVRRSNSPTVPVEVQGGEGGEGGREEESAGTASAGAASADVADGPGAPKVPRPAPPTRQIAPRRPPDSSPMYLYLLGATLLALLAIFAFQRFGK